MPRPLTSLAIAAVTAGLALAPAAPAQTVPADVVDPTLGQAPVTAHQVAQLQERATRAERRARAAKRARAARRAAQRRR